MPLRDLSVIQLAVQYSRTYFDIHLFRQVYKSAIFFLMFLALNSTFTYFDICWNKLVKILFFSTFYQYSDTNSYIFSDFFPSFSRTYFDIHLFRQISPKFLSSLISTCRNKCESTVIIPRYVTATAGVPSRRRLLVISRVLKHET